MMDKNIIHTSTVDASAETSCDLDAAEAALPEAVAAVILQPKPVFATLANARTSSSEIGASRGIDSGYGSQANTPESRIEQGTFTGSVTLPARNLFQRKVRKLRPFNEEIPELIQNRFHDLKELFDEPLYEYLSKAKVKFTSLSIKLKVLGESVETRKPWIVVLCDKTISRRVKQYFNQPHVKIQYQPYNTDPDLPSFQLIVCERPPRPMASAEYPEVYSPYWANMAGPPTLCGTLIRIYTADGMRIATFGGIIKVTDSEKIESFYGMTAGHIIAQPASEEEELESDQSTGEENTEPDDVYLSDDQEIFELELSSEDDCRSMNVDAASSVPEIQGQTPESESSWLKIGYISTHSQLSHETQRNLDWALVKIEDPQQYRPNLLVSTIISNYLTSGVLKEPSYRHRPVVLLTGTNGKKYGMMSMPMSFLYLAPGKNFVETFVVTMSNGSELTPGDCGSWVIDEKSFEVYGHLIASDFLGEAYVVPLDATFQHIKERLTAESVSLPTKNDMKNWERERYQKPQIHNVQASSQPRPQLPHFPAFSRKTESENGRTSVAQAGQPLSRDNVPRAPEFYDDGEMRIKNSGELKHQSIPALRASPVPPPQPKRFRWLLSGVSRLWRRVTSQNSLKSSSDFSPDLGPDIVPSAKLPPGQRYSLDLGPDFVPSSKSAPSQHYSQDLGPDIGPSANSTPGQRYSLDVDPDIGPSSKPTPGQRYSLDLGPDSVPLSNSMPSQRSWLDLGLDIGPSSEPTPGQRYSLDLGTDFVLSDKSTPGQHYSLDLGPDMAPSSKSAPDQRYSFNPGLDFVPSYELRPALVKSRLSPDEKGIDSGYSTMHNTSSDCRLTEQV